MSGKRIRRPSGICCPSDRQMTHKTHRTLHSLRENIPALLKECCPTEIDVLWKKREIVSASEAHTPWWRLRTSCCYLGRRQETKESGNANSNQQSDNHKGHEGPRRTTKESVIIV